VATDGMMVMMADDDDDDDDDERERNVSARESNRKRVHRRNARRSRPSSFKTDRAE